MNSLLKFLWIGALSFVVLFFAKWGRTSYVFYGDALGYYYYLPATFVYHNFHQIEKLPADRGLEHHVLHYAMEFEQNPRSPKGYLINQYTYGVALMELPFFAIAHGYEILTGGRANGFSESYQWMIKWSSMLYAFLGLWILFRVLTMLFSKTIASWTTLVLLLGTNLLWFGFYQSGMSHTILFFLFSALLFTTIRMYATDKPKYFVLTGIICGLITIMRPTDVLCVLIPFLYGLYSKATVLDRVRFFKIHRKLLVLAIVCFLIPILPQLLFWKVYTGSFLYYSYGHQSFDFAHPRLFEGILSAQNGWLHYTPVFLFSIIGLFLFKRIKLFAWSFWLFVPLYVYVIYSWHCYNYINGLGSRPMVNVYPLLAIPGAALFGSIWNLKQKVWFMLSGVLLFVLVSISLLFHMQAVKGKLWSENSTFQFSKQTLFKSNLNYRDLVALDTDAYQPKEEEVEFIKVVNRIDFLQPQPVDSNDNLKYGEGFAIVEAMNEYPSIKLSKLYNSTEDANATWVKCSGEFFEVEAPKDLYSQHLMVCDIKRGNETIYWNKVALNNKVGKADLQDDDPFLKIMHFNTTQWGKVFFFIKLPNDIQQGDEINLSIWNVAKKELKIKWMEMAFYTDKK
jgi:hypothetical protein